ncbi:MAG: GNAT family N-acetyltransferase [Bacillota bacterium]
MSIKRLNKQHYEETLNLSMYAFQYKVPDEEKENKLKQLDDHEIYGIEDEDQIAAKLHLLSLSVLLGEKQYKMGGIAGVATYPEYRRQGLVKELLTFTLKRMREKGQTLSMLHPFSIAFYRKYGWELFAEYKKVRIPKAELIMIKQVPGTVKRFNKDCYPLQIEQTYRQYARQFSGMLVREKDWWKDRTINTLHAAVYYDREGVEKGYILYEIKNQKMKVEEFIVLNGEARNGLWNFICQHDSMLTEAELILPPGDPLPFLLHNPKIQTELHPYFMARVVDVSGFFELHFENFKGELSVKITDCYAPWNNGIFLITSEKVTAQSSSSKADLEMDVNALIPLFFGIYSPEELIEMELIKGNPQKVQLLKQNLQTKPGLFLDFF